MPRPFTQYCMLLSCCFMRFSGRKRFSRGCVFWIAAPPCKPCTPYAQQKLLLMPSLTDNKLQHTESCPLWTLCAGLLTGTASVSCLSQPGPAAAPAVSTPSCRGAFSDSVVATAVHSGPAQSAQHRQDTVRTGLAAAPLHAGDAV